MKLALIMLTCMSLALFLFACGDDDDDDDASEQSTTAIIPINFSNLLEAGDYDVRVTITSPNMEKVTTTQNFSIKPDNQPTEEITLSNIPFFGVNQVVDVEVSKDGTVLYQGEGLASLARDSRNDVPEIVVNPAGHELVATFELTEEATGDFLNARISVDSNPSADTHYSVADVKWKWGDGQQTGFGKEFAASHTYEKVGEYTITLTVRNSAPAPLIAEHQQTITITAQSELVSEKDGATMPLIPAGTFEMGDHFGEGLPHESPVHTVSIDAFYIDVTEVTNAMYQKFMEETGHQPPEFWTEPAFNAPDHPVVGVTWHDAATYAQWAGKRLPTEAEWEYAARGGLVGKRYPWGDDLTHEKANYKGTDGRDIWDRTGPVGSLPENGYGLFDMAGNVWEWCADEYDEGFYAISPESNPFAGKAIAFVNDDFDSVETRRVWRGGSWSSRNTKVTVSGRAFSEPSVTGQITGFRCARTPQP
ncbi:MAG: SUMF1/EgtB/PvdO family nonheme iron enzyme [Candidatus Poribacteria bacterium]|nr:SUMF1/EgtB/PvdO family nonheme iron enzyme [Candidatus Poribacteria bacterium]